MCVEQAGQTHVSETGAHDNGLVTVLFVVIENFLDGLDTRVVVAFVGLAGVLLVPDENLHECVMSLPLCLKILSSRLTRPTNGLINVTPASAHATAWPKPNNKVRLQ
jgi:hypothetical protein